MFDRRAILLSLLGAGLAVSGCTTDNAAPAYSGPTRTVRGYLKGPPYARLSPSATVFITAHDATSGVSSKMPEIGATKFTLNRVGHFPVLYEIEIPASHSVPRISLDVQIRQYGRLIFSNDRQYSTTSGNNLDIPLVESHPRFRSRSTL
ncbi:hypothetical protein [Phyllobacterium sp. SB3]|uniref:hypothetical protein n=1 Tax=Phyllobacterium sp. SB3 TaxID=3156073 RepID=UPI0032AF4F8B